MSDDRKEPKIRQATPKRGLETGSVQGAKGGLVSGKELVAREYAKSLSGAEGPVAMFDAVDEIAAKRVEQALNRLSFAGPGGAAIFGANGQFTVVARQPMPEAGSVAQSNDRALTPWDLVVAEDGKVRIEPGTIIRDASDLTGELTIGDVNKVFSPAAGHIMRIKLSGPFDDPVAVLESGGPWTDFPSAIETTGWGLTAEFVAYRYPLWEFLAASDKGTIAIKSGLHALHARRLVGTSHLIRRAAAYKGAGDRPFAVPVLEQYHRVLSS